MDDKITQWLMGGAILSTTPGKLLLGWGRKKQLESATNLNKKTYFYFPDFFLNDNQPWFEYEYTEEFELNEILHHLKQNKCSKNQSNYSWKNDYYALFNRTFDELKNHMQKGTLIKAVPFVFENAPSSMTQSQLIDSLSSMLLYMQKHPAYLYGFWDSNGGMLGVTPELLFRYDSDQKLYTMACAGTCGKNEDIQTFLSDPKQANEHQCVVDGIKEVLGSFGEVEIGKRELLSLPNINHLVTSIFVKLNGLPNFDKIVKALHPTPALGAFPRQAGMQWLKSYQNQIQRKRFGAPVGYLNSDGTAACYVAIRNVQWDQNEMLVGAGCGIVSASECAKEWAEINLKLKATKEMLDLI